MNLIERKGGIPQSPSGHSFEKRRISRSLHCQYPSRGTNTWSILAREASPRFHKVSKNKECSCGAPYCEAIEAVRQYLQAGGLRAPDPEGMPPCPICGSKTYRDRNWDGKYTRTLGWRCEKGGLRHFLEAKAEWIKKLQEENPWLIPPAPGYPGVRRDELMTWEECQRADRRSFGLNLIDDPMI